MIIMGNGGIYPLVISHRYGKWMNMAHLYMIYLLKIVIFHRYVSLLEGHPQTWTNGDVTGYNGHKIGIH